MNEKVQAAFEKLLNQYAGSDLDGMTAILDEIKPYIGDGDRITALEAEKATLEAAKAEAEAVAAKYKAAYINRWFGRDTSEPPQATVVDGVQDEEEATEERQDDDEPRQLVFDFDNK